MMGGAVRSALLAAALLAASCSTEPSPSDASLDAGVGVDARVDIALVDRAPPMDRGVDTGPDILAVADIPSEATVVDMPDASGAMDQQVPRCEVNTYAPCACPTGQDGTQRCNVVGVYEPCRCGLPMDAGADVVDAPDVVDVPPRDVPPLVLPPRLLLPRSVSRATTQRPTFRWVLPAGVTRARVTLARDRALTRDPRAASVEGDRWRATEALSPGVWFWRVEGLGADGGVAWTSPTWEFFSPRRDSPVDSSWGTSWDFNGDGYDELLLTASDRWVMYPGSPTGPDTSRPREQADAPSGEEINTGSWSLAVGDFNGDGFSDAFMDVRLAADGVGRYSLQLFSGGPDGLSLTPRQAYGPLIIGCEDLSAPFGRVDSIDWDGDGYSDLLVGFSLATTTCPICDAEGCTDFQVYRGGPGGIDPSPMYTFRLNRDDFEAAGYVRGLGDVDGDGYGDAIVLSGDAVFVIHGAPATTDPRSVRVVTIRTTGRYMNGAAGGLGDLDGDGDLEFAVGDLERLRVYSGSIDAATVPVAVIPAPHTPSNAHWNDSFGHQFSQPCDVNGDGRADVVHASPGAIVSPGFTNGAGRIYVFFGRSVGVSVTPDVTFRPELEDRTNLEAGDALQSAGDVNGDGFDDVFASNYNAVDRVRGWYGGAGSIPELPVFWLRDERWLELFSYWSSSPWSRRGSFFHG